MRLIGPTTAALLIAFSVSDLAAEDCDLVTVQNLNSKAQYEILILETSDTDDQGMRDKLEVIKADFQDANAMFSEATDRDDLDEIRELCPAFESLNERLEALKN